MKHEIYSLMDKLVVEDGMSIIMISSELPEVMGISDRIYVMSQGVITGAFDIDAMLSKNVRSYAMYIVLVIIAIFAGLTGGSFMSSRDITNLINQVGYIAVLAIGMTLILIISHIDLSVGYVAGFIGALVAILMKEYSMSAWSAMAIGVGIGAAIGLYQGLLIACVGVPAFVTTLAGMFIFRGVLLMTTQKTGIIIT